jgi:hypothetical protein
MQPSLLLFHSKSALGDLFTILFRMTALEFPSVISAPVLFTDVNDER